jgi:N-acetylneuraminic acid mutarotase
MSYLLIFFFISGLFITAFNPVSAAGLVENSWATKAPMQQARNSLGVVAVDNKIYAIGGYTADSKIVGINEQYDPKTDTWITMASMPTQEVNLL